MNEHDFKPPCWQVESATIDLRLYNHEWTNTHFFISIISIRFKYIDHLEWATTFNCLITSKTLVNTKGERQRMCHQNCRTRAMSRYQKYSQNIYSLLTAREVVTFATSFCKREGLATLRAPAAAFDTTFRIMAGRVRRDGQNMFSDLDFI